MVQDPTNQGRGTKASVVVIPGAACPSQAFYQPLCDQLTKVHGYEAETGDLASASRAPPQTPGTLEDDVQIFHKKIAVRVENGEDVVVVVHSYGGMVATDAVRDLAKADREARGLQGGVVRVIYLTCIVAGLGETAGEVCAKAGLAFKMEPVGENGEYLGQAPDFASMVFSDLPAAEASKWATRQSLQSAICYTGKCVNEAWRYIPITYIVCEEDQVLPLDFQLERVDFLKKSIEGAGLETGLDVRRMKTGHCPNVSALNETAEVIVQAIEATFS